MELTSLQNNIISSLRKEIKNRLSNNRKSHDWDHTQRVVKNALHLCKREGADQFIIHAAALLHDVSRPQEDTSKGKICHAIHGAKSAKQILKKYDLDAESINTISHCVKSHRFRNSITPETIEAKIIHDADKLDAIGAVGIARAFIFAGEVGAKVHDPEPNLSKEAAYTADDTAYREYCVKLKRIKDKLLTKSAVLIAEERHTFMTNFFNRLNDEYFGIK
jgi:uncharacterized protein